MDHPPIINQAFSAGVVPPVIMDRLWADGWRHFGPQFFRYSIAPEPNGDLAVIRPLRLALARFAPSKSQRRVLRRNADAEIQVVPARVDDEAVALFFRHRERFRHNVPDSLGDFIGLANPATEPCNCVCVEVRLAARLIALSYLDCGHEAVSSVYAMFDPEHASRSLGIFTLLKEIEWARSNGKQWLYPGYATAGPGIYDYKKSFAPLQRFDWTTGTWRELASAVDPP